MLIPKTCNCHPLSCRHESDALIIVTNKDGVFDMRGATDEEKRHHKIENLRWRLKEAERERNKIKRELIALDAF